MQPLIPPEQEEQYRKLQEQAQKHAKKQLRRQQHREKGEPESSSSESEEEVEAHQIIAVVDATQSELAEMEAAASAAGEDIGDDLQPTVVALPTPAQASLLQQHHQPTMFVSQPMMSHMSVAGAPHILHAGQPQILVPAHHAAQVVVIANYSNIGYCKYVSRKK